jgi:hypothetical protein
MNSPREKHIAFSISAGCYFYQLGIAYYIQKHFNLTGIKFSGASGGGWPAILLAAGIDVKEGFECVIKYAPECCKNRPVMGAYMVYDQGISIVFEKLFESIYLPDVVNGRLVLSVTRLAWTGLFPYLKDEQVTNFHSNDDIRQCIIASALIPFCLNGKPYVIYRGWICADGGITNVTGVRHFAEELVHDIEMIEEGFAEQAHQLSDHLMENNPIESFMHPHDSAPLTIGPYGIVRFGATISQALVSLLTDSLARLYEGRKRNAGDSDSVTCGIGMCTESSCPHLRGVDMGLWSLVSKRLSCGEISNGTIQKSDPFPLSVCRAIGTTVWSATSTVFDTVKNAIIVRPCTHGGSSLTMRCGDESVLQGTQEFWPDSLLADHCNSLRQVDDSEWMMSAEIETAVSSLAVAISTGERRVEEDECIVFGEAMPSSPFAGQFDEVGAPSSLSSICPDCLGEEELSGQKTHPSSKRASSKIKTSSSVSTSPLAGANSSVIKRDGVIREGGETYWRVKGQFITKTPGGGVQLEISPWYILLSLLR